MTGFDLTLILICLVFILMGFIRGLLRQSIILGSWIAAFIVALIFTPLLAAYFQAYIKDDMTRVLFAFIVIFVLVWLVGVVVKIVVMGLNAESGGGTVSRRGISAVLGFVQGLLACLLLVFIIMNTNFATANWYNEARLLSVFSNLASDMEVSVSKTPQATQRLFNRLHRN